MGYILLIEDNQSNADMMIHILTSEGYTVKHCITGSEGVHAALADHPDMIFLDFNLPDVDGRTLILVFRKRLGKDIPIVACTARFGGIEKRISQSFGSSAFLTKPFTPEELLQTVNLFSKTKAQDEA
ncbi:MAG: response regulator [Chloroflexi bacterium]|nr:response regulator [Chloroflexota bacterium]